MMEFQHYMNAVPAVPDMAEIAISATKAQASACQRLGLPRLAEALTDQPANIWQAINSEHYPYSNHGGTDPHLRAVMESFGLEWFPSWGTLAEVPWEPPLRNIAQAFWLASFRDDPDYWRQFRGNIQAVKEWCAWVDATDRAGRPAHASLKAEAAELLARLDGQAFEKIPFSSVTIPDRIGWAKHVMSLETPAGVWLAVKYLRLAALLHDRMDTALASRMIKGAGGVKQATEALRETRAPSLLTEYATTYPHIVACNPATPYEVARAAVDLVQENQHYAAGALVENHGAVMPESDLIEMYCRGGSCVMQPAELWLKRRGIPTPETRVDPTRLWHMMYDPAGYAA